MEPFGLDDINFFPCACRYQVSEIQWYICSMRERSYVLIWVLHTNWTVRELNIIKKCPCTCIILCSIYESAALWIPCVLILRFPIKYIFRYDILGSNIPQMLIYRCKRCLRSFWNFKVCFPFSTYRFAGFAGTEYEQMRMDCVHIVERWVQCVLTRTFGGRGTFDRL